MVLSSFLIKEHRGPELPIMAVPVMSSFWTEYLRKLSSEIFTAIPVEMNTLVSHCPRLDQHHIL